MSRVRVRRPNRKTKKRISTVRSHHRRKSQGRKKRNFFYSKKGGFIAGGISKKHGPYFGAGYRKGPARIKTSIGLQGHKVSAYYKPTKNTEIGIHRNLTFKKNSVSFKYKKKKMMGK